MCFQGTKDFALVQQCGVHSSAFKHGLRKQGLLLKQALSFPSVSLQGALVPTSMRSDAGEPCAFGRAPISVERWDLAKTEALRPEYIVLSIYSSCLAESLNAGYHPVVSEKLRRVLHSPCEEVNVTSHKKATLKQPSAESFILASFMFIKND